MRLKLKGAIITLVFAVLAGSLLLVNATGSVRAASPIHVATPKLPSPHELYPTKFDANDCRIVPEDEGGGVRCPKEDEPGSVGAKEQDPASEYRMYLGFWGRHYTNKVNDTGVQLLQDTISTTASGQWSAFGLVRNDRQRPVGNVVVKASLLGSDGRILGEASGLVPIEHLRSGEPAPFALTSNVPAIDVANVKWLVTEGSPGPATSRDILFQRYWQIPFGVTVDGVTPGGEVPYAYVMSAGFQVVGRAVHSVDLFVAWVDLEGRVVSLNSTSFRAPAPHVLQKGQSGNFQRLTIGDPAIGTRIGTELTPMYWVVGK